VGNTIKQPEIETRHLSTQELASRLGVPLKSIYYWRATHTGPRAMRVGKYVRYRLEDVLAWEQAQLEPSRTA
jgi:predicted DNA-binding transcriptional regulator AlpA